VILRGSYKVEYFINAIEGCIGGGRHAWTAEKLTPEAVDDQKGLIYLAGGFWRARPTWDEDGTMKGVRLVNPDRTFEEIRLVEQGIAILRHLEFEGG
jgi:hypothetical protein